MTERRIYRLDLTEAELVVLARLVRNLERYSPARRGLYAKVCNKAAAARRERDPFGYDVLTVQELERT